MKYHLSLVFTPESTDECTVKEMFEMQRSLHETLTALVRTELQAKKVWTGDGRIEERHEGVVGSESVN